MHIVNKRHEEKNLRNVEFSSMIIPLPVSELIAVIYLPNCPMGEEDNHVAKVRAVVKVNPDNISRIKPTSSFRSAWQFIVSPCSFGLFVAPNGNYGRSGDSVGLERLTVHVYVYQVFHNHL